MDRLITAAGAHRHAGPDRSSDADVDLAVLGQRLADGVRTLPGVVDVFRTSTGFSRWFGEPSVQLHQEDGRMRAAVSIGVGDDRAAPRTAESVRAYLAAALEADGLAVGGLRVQVALVER